MTDNVLEVKVNGMIGFLIDRDPVYIQDQRRPKGHASSAWPLRELALSWIGPFVMALS